MIYSMRAECMADTDRFFASMGWHGYATGLVQRRAVTLPNGAKLPDVKVQFASPATLDQLRDVIRELPDGHVMLETLRPCPLAENSLERQQL